MGALPVSPWRDATLALLILGFGVKIGIVPFHVWMPLAYRAAPIPAAAVLSGAAVKAGVIGLIRFLPLDAALPAWGEALAAAGLFSAFYGVAIGITQYNPKTVLAYSSVSQMGVIAAVLGMGLGRGRRRGCVVRCELLRGAPHAGEGRAVPCRGRRPGNRCRRLWPVLLPAAVLALGLGGLPLTGGALAKLVVKATLGEGIVGLLASLSSAGTTLLMLHFLSRLVAGSTPDAPPPAARLSLPWIAMAFASVAVPWALYLTVMSGTVSDALAPAALWSAIWPVLLGGVLAIGLWRWGSRLPQVPEGDVVVLVAEDAKGLARATGSMLERLDGVLRQWPFAGVSLLAVAVVLAALMLTGR